MKWLHFIPVEMMVIAGRKDKMFLVTGSTVVGQLLRWITIWTNRLMLSLELKEKIWLQHTLKSFECVMVSSITLGQFFFFTKGIKRMSINSVKDRKMVAVKELPVLRSTIRMQRIAVVQWRCNGRSKSILRTQVVKWFL